MPDRNMTKAEIDLTMKIFTEAKKSGNLGLFERFQRKCKPDGFGEVVINHVDSRNGCTVTGGPLRYQPLKGYRAWALVLLPSTAKEGKLTSVMNI